MENTYDVGRHIVDYHRVAQRLHDHYFQFRQQYRAGRCRFAGEKKGIPTIAITAVEYSDYLTTKA